ncbi:MAG: fumarylacetoacetate hydrolase family protein [Synergistetes bacterium]|nr:fumarylacetoacetate hydrolase family protein [Synergistota bacterium]
MRIGRFEVDGKKFWGVVRGNDICVVSSDWEEFLGKLHFVESTVEECFNINDVKLLAPVVPTKIVALGLNYRDHSVEMSERLPDEPLLFMKPSSAVIGPGEQIIYPSQSSRVDYEAELGVVIGKTARWVKKEEAWSFILGYTCFNDVTARDLQSKDGQWTRAKSFDTFAPIGPYIVTDIDPSDLFIRSYVNDDVKQDSRTSFLIFDIPYILEFVSSVMTLYPGDVIATGTPAGVGPLRVGDIVTIEIEGIGRLTNKVRKFSLP